MTPFTARFINKRGTVELVGESTDETFRRLVVGEVERLFAANESAPRKRSIPPGDAAEDSSVAVVQGLRSLIDVVRPESGIEAAAVFAYAATEAGLAGVTKDYARAWADAVGWPQPADWSRTFNNAKRSGLIRNSRHRYWEPTGEGRAFVTDALWIDQQRPGARRRRKKVNDS
jgi:hypothetical protein